MQYSTATRASSPRSSSDPATPAVVCRAVTKRFYHYAHRTTSLREAFVRTVLRRPLHLRRAEFTLRDFDVTVEKGDAVALVGPNGSGKSTALRLIAGIYPPSDGTVETYGRLAAVIELGVGFHPELTGIENVRLYAAVMGLTRREIDARLPRILDFAAKNQLPASAGRHHLADVLPPAIDVTRQPRSRLLHVVEAGADRERDKDRRQGHDTCGTFLFGMFGPTYGLTCRGSTRSDEDRYPVIGSRDDRFHYCGPLLRC
jgi:hypothetical protein